MKVRFLIGGALGFTLLVACGKEKSEGGESAEKSAAAPAVTWGPGPIQPAPGRKVIVVNLISDQTGNRFEPNEIEAHKGDVIRYTLKIGVHNVHYLPDSNTVKTGLPPASELLQLPGQTYDIYVNFPEGKYYFQCDPHAALGMKGHLKVED
jgi:plastocyanin